MQPEVGEEQIFAPWLPHGWKNLMATWHGARLASLTLAQPKAGAKARESKEISPRAELILDIISGRKRSTEIALDLDTLSDWAKQVVAQMLAIPFGETRSYGQIANTLGNPGAARAVARVCAKNRIGLIVPCHRVTASNGPGGFFWGLPMKERILQFEAEQIARLGFRPT